MPDNNALRIAIIDVENSPSLGWVWEKYQTNVLSFEQGGVDWYMMSFAAKWLGEKKVDAHTLFDYPLYKKEPENDRDLVKDLWRWFDEADIIIGHNIYDFDRRKANSRFIVNKLQPPRPYKTIDTLKIARSQFMFNSNKLDDLAGYLGCANRKIDTGGFNLWLSCIGGDPAAWRKMKKYNIQDVIVSEEVYIKERPWHDHHPNITLANPFNGQCPACGGKTERRGERYMKSFKAERFHCLNKTCGKWSSGKRTRIDAAVLN